MGTALQAPDPEGAAVAAAEALHARVRRVIDRVERGDDVDRAFVDGETFEALARDLARFQQAHVPAYGRRCAGLDLSSTPLDALPAVPTDAFRVARIASFPVELEVARFVTSGTTRGLAAAGVHPMRTLETYRAASLAWARRTLFQPWFSGGSARMPAPTIVALAVDDAAAPTSSLARMLGWFVRELGAPGSCFVAPDDHAGARRTLTEAAAGGAPVLVLATAFAWVHLVDGLGDATIPLPPGSRAMQTGGFKGRSREVSAPALRAAIAHALSIPSGEVVGEYGMTELTSQLYATQGRGSVRDADATLDDARWSYRAPPWVRVRACDPETLAVLPAGRRGIARIEDLANVESAWAVQTADEVVVDARGEVELFGRSPGAPPRGCSLAVEALLAGER